ncbi:hypothetical protein [Amycolatopsis magusensis]|uniref:PH domain-containing protein n=1 Tax=Amycolatopsis magusensis TaxID=882444 RepID=A0ABS4PZ06_9PSEU|nr:hypothetical protein [Amycolatopsis magusensis]MBP2184653.1 hypothetical protein [Amycolatopsis magusensis]
MQKRTLAGWPRRQRREHMTPSTRLEFMFGMGFLTFFNWWVISRFAHTKTVYTQNNKRIEKDVNSDLTTLTPKTARISPQMDAVLPTLKNNSMERWLNYLLLAGPALFALIRFLIVARFDEQRLRVVLRTLDITAVVVSTAVPMLPLATGIAIAIWLRAMSAKPQWRTLHIALTGCTLTAGAGLRLPATYVVVLIIVFGSELWRRSDRVRSISGRWRWFVPSLGYVVTGFTALLAALYLIFGGAGRMWLPTEEVQTGEKSEVGFVLEAGDHDLTFMRRQGGVILIFRQEQVVRRTLCRVEESGWDSPMHPWRLLNDRSVIQMVRKDWQSAGVLPACQNSSQPSSPPT